MTTVATRLEDALAALPTEADEIARVFTELGITGRRGKTCSCPVAEYLKAETGREVEVAMDVVYSTGAPKVVLPHHVVRFIRSFDHGRYPQLIDASSSP
jgi:hypothetical protein